jgi:hypothetical protein
MNQTKARSVPPVSSPVVPESTPPLPAIVAGAYARLNVRLRARMLGRLLAAVGPLALTVVGGGAFAKYLSQARWPEIPVSFDDAERTTAEEVHDLVRYVQQSNPEIVSRLMSLLASDTATIAALGTSAASLAIGGVAGRTAGERRPAA